MVSSVISLLMISLLMISLRRRDSFIIIFGSRKHADTTHSCEPLIFKIKTSASCYHPRTLVRICDNSNSKFIIIGNDFGRKGCTRVLLTTIVIFTDGIKLQEKNPDSPRMCTPASCAYLISFHFTFYLSFNVECCTEC